MTPGASFTGPVSRTGAGSRHVEQARIITAVQKRAASAPGAPCAYVSPFTYLVRLLAGLVLVLLAHRPAAAQPGTVTLSGHVTGSAGGPAAGVTITLTGESSSIPPLTTDATGGFTVSGLAPGLYTVTPSRAGFVHAPASRTVTLLDGDAVVDFTEAVVSHTMAGQVVDANGTPLGGVTVELGGPAAATTTTDASGHFAFFNVPPGGPMTVTPSLAGFTFAPTSHQTQTLAGDLEVPLFTAASGRFQRFLAEGVTNAFFDTRIALLNPTTLPTVARLTFQTSAGHVVAHDVAMAALSRVTIDPRTAGVGEADFSTVIESTQPLVVDRTVRWDPSGYGSHAESSVAGPQTTWYFAEGATTGSFNLFYLLQNPGTQPATVQIRYLRPTPLAPIVKTYSVAPASRRTIYVNQEDPALDEARDLGGDHLAERRADHRRAGDVRERRRPGLRRRPRERRPASSVGAVVPGRRRDRAVLQPVHPGRQPHGHAGATRGALSAHRRSRDHAPAYRRAPRAG